MQSIDDEIPDLSGPVSLGTYQFTWHGGRGKKYETHGLSELLETQEKESENKVTEPASTSSAHPTFNPTPTILSSLQLPKSLAHPEEAELNDRILDRLDKPSPDRRGFHELGSPHYDEIEPSHHPGKVPNPIRSIYTDRQSFQPSSQANYSFPLAQDHRSSQDSNALLNPSTLSFQTSGQVFHSVPNENHRSNQHFSATVNPSRQSSQQAPGKADSSFPLQDLCPNQNFNASINTNLRSPPASRQAYPSFPQPDRQLDTSQKRGQLLKSLNALIQKSDKRSLKASRQAKSPSPPRVFRRQTLAPYLESESKVDDWPAAHRQSSQESSQAHRPASPKDYSSPQSFPFSDTLLTASLDLETDEWIPDSPEANMSAQTPANKSTGGGHSGEQLSRQSSSRMSRPSQGDNIHAIFTTTKTGRPYTNPYMPIDPPLSTARQIAINSPSGQFNTENDDPHIVERQRRLQCIDQELARYRALEEEYAQIEESLDDPFQDQPTHIQHHGRNQPSNFAEHAAQQAAYGQFPGHGHHPTFAAYASDPSGSSLLSNAQQVTHAPSTGMSPYRGYQQQLATNPRASVRLPAVKGTIHQERTILQEPKLEKLSLEDRTGKNSQDLRHRHAQGGIQPASTRASHAVPIRDPAAYTGSGLTTRRNQEALRQNLDTAVASSQGPTGSARTVMNDPHLDRQPPGRSSSAVTDTTVTGSTLRAQAPSYESATAQRSVTTNPAFMEPRHGTSRQGRAVPGEIESLQSRYQASNTLNDPERTATVAELMELQKTFRAPPVAPGFGQDAAAYTKNAGLPVAAIGAGNAFMNEIARKPPPKQAPKQRLDDAATWFRTDPRDLSYAAAILPRETMNRMNPEQFPLEDVAPHTVGQLADDSQDDDPDDRARQAATPRPIGHGRPAGFTTPTSSHGPRQAAPQAPFSTLADVSSVNDTEGMARSGRKFLHEDARTVEAMFGGVYSNLMAGMNGPYDYLNHYAPPPAYAIDHDPKNNHTLFDPQWFATAPPARVGRDPRREQGEYEDPTQGSAGRRGEVRRRESGGRGGGGVRAWGRI